MSPPAPKHHHMSQAMVRSVQKALDCCSLLVRRDKHSVSTGKTHRSIYFPKNVDPPRILGVYSFISSSQHKYKEYFAVRAWGFPAFSPPWIDLEDIPGWKEATLISSLGFTSNNVFPPPRRTQNTRNRFSRRFLQGYESMPEVPTHPWVTGLVVGLGDSSAWVKILWPYFSSLRIIGMKQWWSGNFSDQLCNIFSTAISKYPPSVFLSWHLAPTSEITERQMSSKRHFHPWSVAIWDLIYVIFSWGWY